MSNDIRAWLKDIGLDQYLEAFEKNDIDLDVVIDLTESDIERLGVTSMGHRKKLLRAISKLISSDPGDPPPGDADGPGKAPKALEHEAERRQLTVLFCDLVDSTAMSQRFDPEDMRAVIRNFQSATAAVLSRFEGHIAKFMGDGVLAYFGYPHAHENDAESAVRAGLDLTRAVAELTYPDGEPLSARIGIATGPVVVGDLVGDGAAQEEAVVGVTPNLAARLQSVAEPGQIIISDATKRLAGSPFDLTEVGDLDLKGMQHPVTAYRVNRERLVRSRFEARLTRKLTPLTGREQELALLLERWRLARAREGQMVFLSGEAGIGKSRIVQALTDAVSDDDHVKVMYQCSPYHTDTALYPAIQQLNLAARIRPGIASDEILDRLENVLKLSGILETDAKALLAELVGADGKSRYGKLDMTSMQRRNRTLDLLARQLVGLSGEKTFLFVIEDAHWIDATTLELLDLCLEQIADAPVLIIVTARPTFIHGFGGHPNVTRLALNRLGREHTRVIAQQLTDGKALPNEVLEEIVIKTDGVPLFVEELTKTLLESGSLTETEDGYLLHGTLNQLAIPATLHDSLMARLDRMKPVKEVAQAAACIGRQFDFLLLADVCQLDTSELEDALDQLEGAELLFCRGAPPDSRYTFKHALVRDTAYESLLRSDRQTLHGRIAAALEANFESLVTAEPELAAHHFANSGDFEKGIYYWQLAARRAVERSAHRDAIEHLKRALDLLPEQYDDAAWASREADIQTQLGMAYTATKGQAAPEVETAYLRARRLCEEASNTEQLFSVLRGLWLCYQVGSRLVEAREIGRELLSLATEKENSVYIVEAYRALGQTALWRAEYAASRGYFEDGLDLYDPQIHSRNAFMFGQDPRCVSTSMAGAATWMLGYPDRASQLLKTGVQYAKALNHPYTSAVNGIVATFTCAVRREPEQSRIHAERTIQVATDYELPFFKAFGTVYRGRALVLSGSVEDGLQDIQRGFELSVPKTEAWWPFALIEVYLSVDMLDDARDHLEQALAIVERQGDRLVEAELYRLQGEIQVRDGSISDHEQTAEQSMRRAVETARSQNAKSWELRAVISLARLLGRQRRIDEARDMLSSIYSWFDEGHETPDMKEAKALLNQLS